jgi:hypothetical protein
LILACLHLRCRKALPEAVDVVRVGQRLKPMRHSRLRCDTHLRCRKALSTTFCSPPRTMGRVPLSQMPKGVEHCVTPEGQVTA